MKQKVVTIHEDEGYRTGIIVSTGPKYCGVIWPDSSGITINKVPMTDLNFNEIDYSLDKAKKLLRACGKKFGITKAARRALRA